MLYSQRDSSGWPVTAAITGLGAADPPQTATIGLPLQTAFRKLIYCCYFLLPNVLVTPQLPPRRLQVPHCNRQKSRGCGFSKQLSLEGCWAEKHRVVGSTPRPQRLDFSLFERRFEAVQPEMHMPLGQTPPTSNSGSPGRPILHGAVRRSDDAAALKEGPTLLTVAFSPSR